MSENPKTVFVGLSGGVDSSVAALRLLNEGYHVVGVFIKVWQPDFLECNWEAERLDAMRVAAHLGIPFLTCDAEEAYKNEVGEYFIREYEAGRTPNPDVMCNQHVKFGAFLDFAKKNGADYIATGHYAQVEKNGDNYQLKKGTDPKKDQSYFLWTLSQAQLSQTLFPIGDTPKESIRQEANTAGLPTAVKKDSQGICFLGQVDVPEFLGHFIDLKSGDVLNETGEVIGNHKGALVYTLGQRHGFGIENQENTSEPRYVIAKDVANNTITVSTKPPVTDNLGIITLDSVNWINELTDSKKLTAVFRYHGTPAKVTGLEIFKDQCGLKLDKEIDKPDSGQSCVIYQGDECLGGGIII